jgi:hypothetical protein
MSTYTRTGRRVCSVTYTNVPTMVATQSLTQMYRLWYPLSHLHKCTDYGTHSVTYTNAPTMVPTQSPTRIYRLWYPLSHLHECTSYGTHSVSPRVYRLGVPTCLLYKVPALRTSHYPIQYTGSEASSFSCTVYRPCGTRSLLYSVPAWAHVASHTLQTYLILLLGSYSGRRVKPTAYFYRVHTLRLHPAEFLFLCYSWLAIRYWDTFIFTINIPFFSIKIYVNERCL